MTYRTEVSNLFRDALQDWVMNNKRIALKIFDLMRVIERTPYEGIGKPERLKHEFSGLWSRRIDHEHRIVYKVDETSEVIVFVSCIGHYT